MTANDIAWRPHGYYRTKSHLARFMREYGYEEYDDLIPDTEDDLARFWDDVMDDIGVVWDEEYDRVLDTSDGVEFADWFVGGKLNLTRTLLDRWVDSQPDELAYIWENEAGDATTTTYAELDRETNRIANALRDRGIGRGDIVALVMSLHPTALAASLACFRVGAVQTQIFAGYGPHAIEERLNDCEAKLLFVADGYHRGGKIIDLVEKIDRTLDRTPSVETVVRYDNVGIEEPIENAETVVEFSAFVDGMDDTAETAVMEASEPALIAYSSGTTGKPKGTIHTHTSILSIGAKELRYQFDLDEEDTAMWVTDFGWVVVPAWLMGGAQALGATVVLLGGAPTSPHGNRLWELVERYGITTLGMSPSSARVLRKANDSPREDYDLSTLRVLGSTGEPWDRETWLWFLDAVGDGHIPIINDSGGTETCGGIVAPSTLTPLKPGTLYGPAPGMPANVYDADGNPSEKGYLVIEGPTPGMTRGLTGGDDRYLEEYWSDFDGVWNQNDWVEIDDDGFWYVTGRADDTMNVSGRRVTAPEIEEAILEHPAVDEAVVISVSHETKGEAPVGFITVDETAPDDIETSVSDLVVDSLGAPFRLKAVHVVRVLPRTQTGKLPRSRIRMTYEGEEPDDVSTLENGDALREYPRRG